MPDGLLCCCVVSNVSKTWWVGLNKLLYRLFKSTSDMATSRKKVVLTIKEKYLALKKLEKEGTSKKSIAEKYDVPPNTLSYWIKNKADIFTNYESG